MFSSEKVRTLHEGALQKKAYLCESKLYFILLNFECQEGTIGPFSTFGYAD